jgi:hypothetical protein
LIANAGRSGRWASGLAVLLCVVADPGAAAFGARPPQSRPAPATPQDLRVMDALELYALGDPAVIRMVAEPRAIGSISAALARDGAAWIRANGPAETSHRRLVAVTFALEAVRHVFENLEGAAAVEMLRWASGELQQESKPTEAERLWRRGAIAILQGAVALQSVDSELNIAKSRFPTEPRWLLIRAWHTELSSRKVLRPSPLDGVIELPVSVIRAYEDALRAPETRAEAATRLAYLRCASGRVDLAIDLATQGATLTTEPDIRSLAHLIHGWALTRGGRPADALVQFRAAHESMPASQSAALWFAQSLFLVGQRTDAESLVDETMRTGLGELDPLRMYPRGDFRLWPALIAELRRAIR